MIAVSCAFGRELDHVGGLAEGVHAALLGDLHARPGESVCWVRMSAPWSNSALAASASLPGSNQEFTQTILTLMSGLTDCAPSMKALMPDHDLGDREGDDVAGSPAFDIFAAICAHDVAALVEAGRVGREVVARL